MTNFSIKKKTKSLPIHFNIKCLRMPERNKQDRIYCQTTFGQIRCVFPTGIGKSLKLRSFDGIVRTVFWHFQQSQSLFCMKHV